MKKKNSLILSDEFNLYCEINNIEDKDKLAKQIFEKGFSIEKYGEAPSVARGKDKIVTKEVIKEVPVEVIKEVEKIIIKEVPVEKIVYKDKIIEVIKEVPVDKIVEVIKEVPIEVAGDTKVITVTNEVIKEVPVERIVEVIKEIEVIKEVVVEKIITNDEEVEKLKAENAKLNEEMNKFTSALSKMSSKAKYAKNSNLNDLYDE